MQKGSKKSSPSVSFGEEYVEVRSRDPFRCLLLTLWEPFRLTVSEPRAVARPGTDRFSCDLKASRTFGTEDECQKVGLGSGFFRCDDTADVVAIVKRKKIAGADDVNLDHRKEVRSS